MIDDSSEHSDKATAVAATGKRGEAPTPRRIKAGALLATGKARSTGEALVKAGYSPATAHNPRQNGLSPERLLREAAEAGAGEDALRGLRRPALAALHATLTNPEVAPGVRAPAALGTLKLLDEAGIGESDDPVADQEDADWERRAWYRLGRWSILREQRLAREEDG